MLFLFKTENMIFSYLDKKSLKKQKQYEIDMAPLILSLSLQQIFQENMLGNRARYH